VRVCLAFGIEIVSPYGMMHVAFELKASNYCIWPSSTLVSPEGQDKTTALISSLKLAPRIHLSNSIARRGETGSMSPTCRSRSAKITMWQNWRSAPPRIPRIDALVPRTPLTALPRAPIFSFLSRSSLSFSSRAIAACLSCSSRSCSRRSA
jgi:hypothetical protein